ncbi:MAG: hypothetical protein H0T59_07530 [Chloroflexi bacterium]|nr:hypothetical protein [Chloroflexota bacterium]
MSRSELLVTALHELRHIVHGPRVTGKTAESDQRNEADAERWGRQAALAFGARPRGIKSALDLVVPTASLGGAGHVLGYDRRPGLTSRTDFGQGMYPNRPLILNGWGASAKRIGDVTDLEADDEDGRIWARAQIDKANQYRAYVLSLIQQGAVDAKAMVLDEAIQRDWSGRLSQLPIVGVELRPAGLA